MLWYPSEVPCGTSDGYHNIHVYFGKVRKRQYFLVEKKIDQCCFYAVAHLVMTVQFGLKVLHASM